MYRYTHPTIWCTENWDYSHCIFRLQLVVCNIGSDYDDSLYVVIPEKHTICDMDYKKEIAKQKLGFTKLNACCVSTDVGMYGCMEKLVTKDGFCIYLRLKSCFYQRWWTHIFNSERFDLCHCFKSTLQCERYLGCMQSRIYKTALARFWFGVSRINCHRLRFSAAFDLRNCPFYRPKMCAICCFNAQHT